MISSVPSDKTHTVCVWKHTVKFSKYVTGDIYIKYVIFAFQNVSSIFTLNTFAQ